LHYADTRPPPTTTITTAAAATATHQVYQRIIEEAKNCRNEQSEVALMAEGDYALLLLKTGRLEEATKTYKKVWMGKVTLYGENNENTLLTKADLASVLVASGQIEAAERKLREVLAKLGHSIGKHTESTLAVMVVLADVLTKSSGTREEALGLYNEVLVARRGEGASSTVMSVKANLAVCYDQTGQTEQAEKLTEEVRCRGNDRHIHLKQNSQSSANLPTPIRQPYINSVPDGCQPFTHASSD